MAFRATRALRSIAQGQTGGVVPVHKKYTVQSVGIWERLRRLLSVDPNRSTGVPLNPQFRNPPPGANDPAAYDDPITIPAGDIADNPYWKRDVRRSYPRLSVVDQGHAVGLLSVGSAAAPSEALPAGEAGAQALVALKQEGEQRGLAGFFEQKGAQGVVAVLGENGLPPTAPGLNVASKKTGEKRYVMNPTAEQSYGDAYPCRTFI